MDKKQTYEDLLLERLPAASKTIILKLRPYEVFGKFGLGKSWEDEISDQLD